MFDTYYYLPLYFKRDMLIRFQDIQNVSTMAMENCIMINGEYLKELEKRSDFDFMLHKVQYLTEIKKILKENNIFTRIKRKFMSYFDDINEHHLLTRREKNALLFMFFHIKFSRMFWKVRAMPIRLICAVVLPEVSWPLSRMVPMVGW